MQAENNQRDDVDDPESDCGLGFHGSSLNGAGSFCWLIVVYRYPRVLHVGVFVDEFADVFGDQEFK